MNIYIYISLLSGTSYYHNYACNYLFVVATFWRTGTKIWHWLFQDRFLVGAASDPRWELKWPTNHNQDRVDCPHTSYHILSLRPSSPVPTSGPLMVWGSCQYSSRFPEPSHHCKDMPMLVSLFFTQCLPWTTPRPVTPHPAFPLPVILHPAFCLPVISHPDTPLLVIPHPTFPCPVIHHPVTLLPVILHPAIPAQAIPCMSLPQQSTWSWKVITVNQCSTAAKVLSLSPIKLKSLRPVREQYSMPVTWHWGMLQQKQLRMASLWKLHPLPLGQYLGLRHSSLSLLKDFTVLFPSPAGVRWQDHFSPHKGPAVYHLIPSSLLWLAPVVGAQLPVKVEDLQCLAVPRVLQRRVCLLVALLRSFLWPCAVGCMRNISGTVLLAYCLYSFWFTLLSVSSHCIQVYSTQNTLATWLLPAIIELCKASLLITIIIVLNNWFYSVMINNWHLFRFAFLLLIFLFYYLFYSLVLLSFSLHWFTDLDWVLTS